MNPDRKRLQAQEEAERKRRNQRQQEDDASVQNITNAIAAGSTYDSSPSPSQDSGGFVESSGGSAGDF